MTGFMGAVAVTAAAAMVLPGAARAEDCLTDWGMAGQIVRRENLITVQEVSQSLAADGIGELVKPPCVAPPTDISIALSSVDRRGSSEPPSSLRKSGEE